MTVKRLARSTWYFSTAPEILSGAAVAGPRESQGMMGEYFDHSYENLHLDKKSFEQAEQYMQQQAAALALEKVNLCSDDIDILFAGDLINQITPSCFTARGLKTPFCGVFSACATMAQAVSLAALAVCSGAAIHSLALASSHTCAAEKQFRYPNEYGSQKPPYSQQTATAAGAVIIGRRPQNSRVRVRAVTLGQLQDMQITDPFKLGAAMAPAWADTVETHLRAREQQPADYDLILSGDLGRHGGSLGLQLLAQQGIHLPDGCWQDCGLMMLGQDERAMAGGSGCGCAAAVLSTWLWQQLSQGKLRRVLLVATGALLSPLANQQQETIPGIAHGIELEGGSLND